MKHRWEMKNVTTRFKIIKTLKRFTSMLQIARGPQLRVGWPSDGGNLQNF